MSIGIINVVHHHCSSCKDMIALSTKWQKTKQKGDGVPSKKTSTNDLMQKLCAGDDERPSDEKFVCFEQVLACSASWCATEIQRLLAELHGCGTRSWSADSCWVRKCVTASSTKPPPAKREHGWENWKFQNHFSILPDFSESRGPLCVELLRAVSVMLLECLVFRAGVRNEIGSAEETNACSKTEVVYAGTSGSLL